MHLWFGGRWQIPSHSGFIRILLLLQQYLKKCSEDMLIYFYLLSVFKIINETYCIDWLIRFLEVNTFCKPNPAKPESCPDFPVCLPPDLLSGSSFLEVFDRTDCSSLGVSACYPGHSLVFVFLPWSTMNASYLWAWSSWGHLPRYPVAFLPIGSPEFPFGDCSLQQ